MKEINYKPPKISVIVPVYNSEQYLHKCIDSILLQTFTDFELILINDGSKDGSGDICNQYEDQDNRVKVYHKENGGVSKARNLGISNAVGEYLCFIDSDDWVESFFLDSFFKKGYEEFYDFYIQGYTKCFIESNKKEKVIFDDESRNLENNIGKVFIYGEVNNINNSPCWKLFKTEIVRDHKIIFDENICYGEDHLFVLAFYKYIERVSVSIECGYHYCHNDTDSLTTIYTSDYKLDYYSSCVYDKRQEIIKHLNLNDDIFNVFVNQQYIIYKLLMIVSLYDKNCTYSYKIKKEKLKKYTNEFNQKSNLVAFNNTFYRIISIILSNNLIPKYISIYLIVRLRKLLKLTFHI